MLHVIFTRSRRGGIIALLAAASRTNRAPISAIITVGELVLPEVMVGMIEASITRRPASTGGCAMGSRLLMSPAITTSTLTMDMKLLSSKCPR